MKEVLVVDDSAFMRRITADIINADKRFKVTGFASDGFEALDNIYSNYGRYSAVILDINMPRMTGIDVLKELKRHNVDIKVIVSSSITVPMAAETIMALELGAFDFVTKPAKLADIGSSGFSKDMMAKLCEACGEEVIEEPLEETYKVPEKTPVIPQMTVKSFDIYEKEAAKRLHSNISFDSIVIERNIKTSSDRLVFIIASTGGPKVLMQLLSLVDKNISVPVLILQHMPKGFTHHLAKRLNDISEVEVKEIQDGDVPKIGSIHLAKGGCHLLFEADQGMPVFRNVITEPVRGLMPCADLTIGTLENMFYREVLFVVLTGMGNDATEGIRSYKKKNRCTVIAQNEESCTVYGMPKSLVNEGLADKVLPIERIAREINRFSGVNKYGR